MACNIIFFVRRQITCLVQFLSPTTLYREGEKPSEYCTLLLPMAGIKPGPPVQQASALSIALWQDQNYISVGSGPGWVGLPNVQQFRCKCKEDSKCLFFQQVLGCILLIQFWRSLHATAALALAAQFRSSPKRIEVISSRQLSFGLSLLSTYLFIATSPKVGDIENFLKLFNSLEFFKKLRMVFCDYRAIDEGARK